MATEGWVIRKQLEIDFSSGMSWVPFCQFGRKRQQIRESRGDEPGTCGALDLCQLALTSRES